MSVRQAWLSLAVVNRSLILRDHRRAVASALEPGDWQRHGDSMRCGRRSGVRLARPGRGRLGLFVRGLVWPTAWKGGPIACRDRSTRMSLSRSRSQESGSSASTTMSATLPTSSDPERSSFQVRRWPLCAAIRRASSRVIWLSPSCR